MLPALLAPILSAQFPEIKDEDVSLLVAGKTLKGSLTRGDGVKRLQHHVVFIISGSGATDRDGNSLPMMKNNSLKLLAHAITRNGISTLRVDKRGVAGSKGAVKKEEELRFTTYVDDVTHWMPIGDVKPRPPVQGVKNGN